MAVTTLLDVEAALVRSLTDDEMGHVVRVLELVEAEVLGQLPGYDLNPASVDTVTLAGSYDDTLTLPEYPVTVVSAVSVNGVALVAADWSVSPKGYLSRVATGYGWGSVTTAWGYTTGTVTVTYTHGQPAAGSPLVGIIAEAVAARLVGAGRQGMRSMSIDTYSESYETAPERNTAGIDPKRLAPYRRSTVGSISLIGA